MLSCLEREQDDANLIVVPGAITRPSAALIETIQEVAAIRRHSALRPVKSKGRLPLTGYPDRPTIQLPRTVFEPKVSSESVDRALLLMDTLIKACTERGLSATVKDARLLISHDGSSVDVRISERIVTIVGSPKGFSQMDVLLNKHVTYRPTGELTIGVARLGNELKVKDKNGLPLERQLNNVLKRIYRGITETRVWFEHLHKLAAESAARAEIKKSEDAARKAAIEAAQRDAEELRQKRMDLAAEAMAWQQSQTILAYAAHLVQTATRDGRALSTDLQAWVDSISKIAKALDPTTRRLGQYSS